MKRKLKKLSHILKNTKVNKDLFRFTANFMRHALGRYKKNPDKELAWPTTLMLELSSHCNLRCITCPREYDFGKKMDRGYMDSALARKIIDESLPYLKSIGLTGMGETLFAPNLLEISKYIKEKKPGIVTFISTNANFPDFIERITPVIPYIDTIQISTDGVGAGYEQIRKGGSFELLEKNLAQLAEITKDADVDLMFNMVITRRNFTQMSDVIEFASKYNVKYVNFSYFNLASTTSISSDYYQFFSSEEFLSNLEKVRETIKATPWVTVTGLDFPGNPGIKKCPLLWDHFQINFDGEVPPCCAKPFPKEYSFGNVTSESIREVINSQKARQFRKQWFVDRPNEFCKKCHFIHL